MTRLRLPRHPIAARLALVATLACPLPSGAVTAQPPDRESDPVLRALSTYVGTWRADERVDPDGVTRRFVYTLSWFNDARSVLEMRITDLDAQGGERLLWSGFKGWRASDGTVFYFGFSPGGRSSEGHVELDGENLVTSYAGWGPDGPTVEVRDVFGPVEGDAFVGQTWIRPNPEAEWRRLSSDSWTRVPTAGDASVGGALPFRRPAPRWNRIPATGSSGRDSALRAPRLSPGR